MAARENAVAVVGLGVMGANLARNFASRGLAVAGYDRAPDAGRRLQAVAPEARIEVADSLPALVASLERPRRIVALVNAGAPVDAVVGALDPLLEEDDVVVDAGNSLYMDTDRRQKLAEHRPWRFMGMGVSGGSEGALRGPALRPGGDQAAWTRMRPVLEAIAAVGSDGPCVTYCGAGSAGHFVKMVHNGIEYGDMQLITEAALLLRQGLGLAPAAVADTFDRWNQGELASYLIEITGRIFRVEDPQAPGKLLVDAVLDQAGQKGTGRWTVIAALELGVAIPTIAAAVDARNLSALRAVRLDAKQAMARDAHAPLAGITAEDVAAALYAAKLSSYTQGFAMLETASRTLEYGIDLPEVARIWTGGCIIRASLLQSVRQALSAEPRPELLALSPTFAAQLRERWPAWRRVVAAATAAGYAVPGLASSLAWLETLTTGRGTAALIQAQRDYFGSHGYQRVEEPGKMIHTDWASGR
jgi:6-phosphogluconate dehydrogenase